MELLIVIRRGHDDDHGLLSERGQQSIAALLRELDPVLCGRRIRIRSSHAPAAQATAELIAQSYPSDSGLLGSLNEGRDWELSQDAIFERIDGATDVDVLILVTHRYFTACLPVEFARRKWYQHIAMQALDLGEAWIIDCGEQSRVHIRPPRQEQAV